MLKIDLKSYCCLLLSVVLCSCAKGEYRKAQKKLATLYSTKKYEEEEKLVKQEKFLPNKNNELLKNIELGTAYYNNEKYCNAIEKLNNAGRIIEEQYTKSISSAVSSSLGVGEDVFYGETYEKSLLNFYKSLINYEIYSRGYCEPVDDKNAKKEKKYLSDKEKLNFLNASRSNILYWDSWISGRYIEDDDKFYINDVLLKLWGAFIHEQIGDKANLQIAKHLYNDAKDVAKNRYIVYKTFNKKNINFTKHLKDLQKRSEFIEQDNIYVNDIIEYCDRQLERLNNNIKINFAIVLSDNAISTKGITKHKIPILSILSTASANIMDMIFSFGIDNATYELPYINYKSTEYRYFYEIKKDDTVIIKKPIVLSEPITDISYMSLNEKINGIKKRVITSMTAKYISVLTPIAVTYMATKKSKNEFVKLAGLATALATYKASEYIITESSKVDIRQWVTLPSNIFMTTDSLEKGNYKLRIIKQSNQLNNNAQNGIVNNNQEMVVYQKDITIDDNVAFFDIKL